MNEECNDLRTKHLDNSTVPWNIRGKTRNLKIIQCNMDTTKLKLEHNFAILQFSIKVKLWFEQVKLLPN